MNFISENLVLIVIVAILIFLVIKFLKGVAKVIIAIILFLTIGVSCYNLFITHKSFSYELNRYKTDFTYISEMKDITVETKDDVEKIKQGQNAKENINNIVALRNKANKLNHSSDIDFIHKRYIEAMDSIILATKGYSTAKNTTQQIDNASKSLEISLKDIF